MVSFVLAPSAAVLRTGLIGTVCPGAKFSWIFTHESHEVKHLRKVLWGSALSAEP